MPPNGPYSPYPYGAPPVPAHVPHTSIESEILVSHTPRAEDGPQASEAPNTQPPCAQTKPPAPEESAAVGGYRSITEKEVKPAVVFGSIAPDGTQTLYCPECYVPLHPDPEPSRLFIYLHAKKYSTDEWSFETEMPDWAREDYELG